MCKTIDTQAHADIVGLIETEMGEVACGNYPVSADRLASLIAGRLGYGQETPKKTTFPELLLDITDDFVVISSGVDIIARYALFGEQKKSERAIGAYRLMAAAPKLADLLAELCSNLTGDTGVKYNYAKAKSNRTIEEVWQESVDVLREAGADI